MKLNRHTQLLIEQVAVVLVSLIWTAIVLLAITLYWAYQDIQARWAFVLNAPPEALAQSLPEAAAVVIEGTPTPTPWAGPGPTATPTATKWPTPTATRVIPLPEVLPETLTEEDPVPVVIHTAEEVDELLAEQGAPSPAAPPASTATPEPALEDLPLPLPIPEEPTATPTPPPSGPQIASSGIPSHLAIPSVGIDSKIISVGWNVVVKDGQEYSIWQVADYAIGWHKTTALLGQAGNTVMAGHHNINGEIFRDLVNVEVGDKVEVWSDNQKYEYVVDFKTIVKEKGESVEVRRKNAQWIAPTNDERLTLVTCWPYTNNTHRVIVVAKPL